MVWLRPRGATGQTAAQGSRGLGPGEVVADGFVDRLPESNTGWGAGSGLRGWAPRSIPWGQQVQVSQNPVVDILLVIVFSSS